MAMQISYDGPIIKDGDGKLTVLETSEKFVKFQIDDGETQVMYGSDLIDMLVAEGIVAVLSKAVMGVDGYGLQYPNEEAPQADLFGHVPEHWFKY